MYDWHGNRSIILLTSITGLEFVINAIPFIYNYGTFYGTWYSSSYVIPHLISIWETLLIVKLNNAIQKTYLFTNNLVTVRKGQCKGLRKVVPISTQRKSQKFEHGESLFTKRNMNDVIESHYKATMVSKGINNLFEFPILITLATNFMSLSLSFYYIVIVLGNIEKGDVILAVLWPLTIMVGQTIIIVRSFDTLATEVDKNCYYYFTLNLQFFLRQKRHQDTFMSCGMCYRSNIKKETS